MPNFDYLAPYEELQPLRSLCLAAAERQQSEPDQAAISARRALEWLVRAVCHLKGMELSDRSNLYELLQSKPMRDLVGDNSDLSRAIHWVRRVGNAAAHNVGVSARDAGYSVRNLDTLVRAILARLGIPTHTLAAAAPTRADDISEAETRRTLIDLMLREAGWQVLAQKGAILPSCACIEVELRGMPNASGLGYADYVLFGADGRPLAVVEAKRTSVSPLEGEQQAKLYADLLERRYGVRPAIYLTNGYETWIVDPLGYPRRPLYAFHTEADLMWLHQQHERRRPIADMTLNPAIAGGRPYQQTAVKSICEHLNRMHRRGLLVMATGTGKTRTAMALVDVLQRADWVKRVLFLADRTALVAQAHAAFAKLMPWTTTALVSGSGEPDKQARLLFSTYQTMINHVEAEGKSFSVGHFDLIIIDEAHRSVFGKYGAIFDYFDSLLIGLTATPREQVDRSTYDLLQLDDGVPNFAYELDEAVRDGFLVPYEVVRYDSDVMRQGIAYDRLTPDEREQLEAVWEYESLLGDEPRTPEPRDILEAEIFRYIYNTDTVDRMLQALMEEGLRVDGGERIGKSIIFAFNSRHARLIVERFNRLYPELGPEFCRQIDYSVGYAQSLIDAFSVRGGLPQVAVSVDMLDTGVDVPDVLNLVFFKRIRSRIKFMQMIGRGTRLSPDIFGGGRDKEKFLIFDWGGNFDYFALHPKEARQPHQPSLSERLFALRTDVAYALQEPRYQAEEFASGFCRELKEGLRGTVVGLSDSLIAVRREWDAVCRFRTPQAWLCLTALDAADLKSRVAPLVPGTTTGVEALRFDLLALNVQLALVDPAVVADAHEERIRRVAHALTKKTAIPAVMAKLPLLLEVEGAAWWEHRSLERLEAMRLELRELVRYLSGQEKRDFEVDIPDRVERTGPTAPALPRVSYRERVMDYLARHADHEAIRKIHNLEPLTASDVAELEHIFWHELGSRQEYGSLLAASSASLDAICSESVAAFIRTLVKVDHSRALRLFTQFIAQNALTAKQEEYLKSIVDYVGEAGDIHRSTLLCEEPFSQMPLTELFAANALRVAEFVDSLHKVIVAA